MATTGKDLTLAANLLLQGRLVAIPTETVYGLAANATDEKAVIGIFEAKQRPFFDPLIIHINGIESVNKYAVLEHPLLIALAQAFWPGPLTLLLPKKDSIPDIVTSGLSSVAVRVPEHPLTLQLLAKINLPLAAPSANPFGYVSPTEPVHVENQLGSKIDYILDGGACRVGLESTIVGLENGHICVYRLGGLAIESIEKVCGTKVEQKIIHSSNPVVPGQLKSHYAPLKPLMLGKLQELIDAHKHKKLAVLCFGKPAFHANTAIIFNLSPHGDLSEAAANLFRYIRLADESAAELVICELLPELGLGKAINDRLLRASLK